MKEKYPKRIKTSYEVFWKGRKLDVLLKAPSGVIRGCRRVKWRWSGFQAGRAVMAVRNMRKGALIGAVSCLGRWRFATCETKSQRGVKSLFTHHHLCRKRYRHHESISWHQAILLSALFVLTKTQAFASLNEFDACIQVYRRYILFDFRLT